MDNKLIESKYTEQRSIEPIAIIDIGSNEIGLKIVQAHKEKIKILENIYYPLSLGRDTFSMGMISYEKVHSACEIIHNYMTVCKDYDIKKIKAIATSAIREANNRDYILDQIKIKTGLDIRVLDDNLEKNYIFKLMYALIHKKYQGCSLMVYSGSGSISISLLKNHQIPFMDSIKIGSLRISELFDDLHEYTSDFYHVVEEYMGTFFNYNINHNFPKVEFLVASGLELSTIASLCNAVEDGLYHYIDREAFFSLYENTKYMSIEKIVRTYALEEDKADILISALCIYKYLFEITNTQQIITPLLYLSDAIAFETLFENRFNDIHKQFFAHTTASAAAIALKYHCIENHYQAVTHFSNQIFDKMKKIHGLGRKEKLYLQTAAILHDCGKFINLKNHHIHSYNLIRGSDIVGLSKEEIDIIATIALYHSKVLPSYTDKNYRNLKPSKKVLVSKLAAILRLADALDSSHKYKYHMISVEITKTELLILVNTDYNIALETWSLMKKGQFFEEVFGLKPVIKKQILR